MPYIAQPLALESTPAMSEWTNLQLPTSGEITAIEHIRMPKLVQMQCDYSQLATLPWPELKSLQLLGVYGCKFVTLELWQLTNLYACYAGDNHLLTTVDAHDAAHLTDLDVGYCTALLELDVLGCASLQYIYAFGAALPEATVDQLLADLVANGASDGYLQVNGPGNAAPSSPDGMASQAILVNRGWTIIHN